jgi:hypothetical protein
MVDWANRSVTGSSRVRSLIVAIAVVLTCSTWQQITTCQSPDG